MSTFATEILILEDDALAASELKDCLTGEGLKPSIVSTKKQFERSVERHEYQLLIIDIGLPDGSGLDVIREVRAQSSVGIIVISGHTEEADVVAAIELGADDYLKKPISLRELRAKVRRMIIRTGGTGYSKKLLRSNKHEQKTFGDWRLDIDNHRLFYKKNQEVDLTTAEFKVLLALLENSDRILTRDSLLDNLHGISNPYDERTIDGLISRVRKKLAIPDSYKPIKTVRNVGYMFCERVHTERH
ncbi:MAG: response regulator transcription factor [Halioglobus sp.]